jgi:hypothetical protein
VNALDYIKEVTKETSPLAGPGGSPLWGQHHEHAMEMPAPGFERALVRLLLGFAEYADVYKERYESPVGEDGYLGDKWEDIASGILGLLNGEHGRLDACTFDKMIRQIATDNGGNIE